jgi:hypothetical protein
VIQAYTGNGVVVVGITRGNVDRLLAGKPATFDLVRPVERVVLFFGEDKPSIIAEIEAKTPFRFEASHKAAAMEDPL